MIKETVNLENILDSVINKTDLELFGEDRKSVLSAMKTACEETVSAISKNTNLTRVGLNAVYIITKDELKNYHKFLNIK